MAKNLKVELKVGESFFESMRIRAREKDPPEDVVMVVPRPGGNVLLHTKIFYPGGTYRLPTGWIKAGESPDDAFAREFREELGFDGEIDRKLGMINYRFVRDGEPIESQSHVYLARETAIEPHPADEDEEISDFIEVRIGELPEVAKRLRSLRDEWSDWGRFRAVAHDFVAAKLRPKKA